MNSLVKITFVFCAIEFPDDFRRVAVAVIVYEKVKIKIAVFIRIKSILRNLTNSVRRKMSKAVNKPTVEPRIFARGKCVGRFTKSML